MALPIEELKTRLNRAMSIRNMKAVDLVEKTGIPKSAISHYMSGHVKPKQDRIALISDALNIQEAWLLGYDVPMDKVEKHPEVIVDVEFVPNSKSEEHLLAYYRKLNEYGKKKLLDNMEDLLEIEKYTSVPVLNAAHERTDIDISEYEDTADNDIMDDENF